MLNKLTDKQEPAAQSTWLEDDDSPMVFGPGPRLGHWFKIVLALGVWAVIVAFIFAMCSIPVLIAGCASAGQSVVKDESVVKTPFSTTFPIRISTTRTEPSTSALGPEPSALRSAMASPAQAEVAAAPADPLLVSWAGATGVPIGPQHVITAAHTRYGAWQPWESVTQPGKGVGLVARVQHPTLDLQILKLESPLTRWSAVSFAPVVIGQPLKFAGCAQCAWGAGERWADAGVVIDGVTSITFGGVSGIQGDSGGGVFVMDGDRAGPAAGSSASAPALKLTGVVIMPNTAVRLSAAESWIKEQLRQSPDFNLDGQVNVQDINDFITDWQNRKAPVQEYLDFVSSWLKASRSN